MTKRLELGIADMDSVSRSELREWVLGGCSCELGIWCRDRLARPEGIQGYAYDLLVRLGLKSCNTPTLTGYKAPSRIVLCNSEWKDLYSAI